MHRPSSLERRRDSRMPAPSTPFNTLSAPADNGNLNDRDTTSVPLTASHANPQIPPICPPIITRLRFPFLFVVTLLTSIAMASRLLHLRNPLSGRTNARKIDSEQLSSANTFSFRLFGTVAENRTDVLLSPPCLASALMLARIGATPESVTEAEFKKLMAYVPPSLRVSGAGRHGDKSKVVVPKDVTLMTAISVWAKGTLRPEYLTKVKSDMEDGETVHFKGGSFTGTEVNEWIKAQTNGQISSIVDEELPANLLAFLLSAVYFAAPWTTSFNPEQTFPLPFSSDESTQIPIMHLKNEKMPYTTVNISPSTESYEYHLVDIPYGKDHTYAMSLFVPMDRTTATDATTHLVKHLQSQPDAWTNWQAQLKDTKIDTLGLPRFKLEFGTESMKSTLQHLGLNAPFVSTKDNPQLSTMTSDPDAYISDVMHRASVQCTEKGTVASAASAVVIQTRSLPISNNPRIIADRPFLFVIHERVSRLVLFVGRLDKPKEP